MVFMWKVIKEALTVDISSTIVFPLVRFDLIKSTDYLDEMPRLSAIIPGILTSRRSADDNSGDLPTILISRGLYEET